MPCLCHQHHDFPLCGRQPVVGTDGPPVFFILPDVLLAHVHHRFDGKDHSRNHQHSAVFFGRIADPGILVELEAPVFLGGPVADDQLFFIHTLGDLIPDSAPIIDGLYWGGDNETLKTLVNTGIANEDNVRFFLGYAGWDSGQLVGELVRNSWLVGQITAEQYLHTTPERMWEDSIDRMKGPYEMWKRFPRNFEDN